MPIARRLFWLTCGVLLFGTLAAGAARGGPGEFWSQLGLAPESAHVSHQPHPSVARIVVPQQNSTSFGSGTIVAAGEKHAIVVTNWHVVEDSAGVILVRFPDGFQSHASVVKVDRDWDLAALAIWKPNAAPVTIASAPPWPGEPLTIAGYGSGTYRAATGVCTQYVSPSEKHPFEMLEISVAARNGDSGGPILNQRGELAGVLFGEGGGKTAGSYCGRVREFLANVTPLVTRGELPGGVAATTASNSTATNATRSVISPPSDPMARVPHGGDSLPSTTMANQSPASALSPTNPSSTSPPSSSNWVRVRPPGPIDATPPLASTTAPLSPGNTAQPAQPASSSPMFSSNPPGNGAWSVPPPNTPNGSTNAAPGFALPAIPWDHLLGVTPLEKTKSGLAVIGALAVFLTLRRTFRGAEAPAKK